MDDLIGTHDLEGIETNKSFLNVAKEAAKEYDISISGINTKHPANDRMCCFTGKGFVFDGLLKGKSAVILCYIRMEGGLRFVQVG